MKARPCQLVAERGYVACPSDEATHLTFIVPGPAGWLTLPVQIHGRREGTGNWTWNGDTEKPTLRPSILTTGTRFEDGDPSDKANWVKFRCHIWLNDGQAQFLDDCSHELRGQTIPLLDLPIEPASSV